MIASLPMYRRPELQAAHASYWTSIRIGLTAAGIESPTMLDEEVAETRTWTDPGLVLSQTCGMPFRLGLHNTVQLVGTPDFAIDGCQPGYYRSALIVRIDDHRHDVAEFERSCFVYNQTDSQSGYSAPYFHTVALGFWFANQICSGSHLESAKWVADGQADIAAIDAVTLRMIQRYDQFSSQLRVLEWTSPSPSLPYITSASADRDGIYGAVSAAIDGLNPDDRFDLGIVGLVQIPEVEYLSIPSPPAESRSTNHT